MTKCYDWFGNPPRVIPTPTGKEPRVETGGHVVTRPIQFIDTRSKAHKALSDFFEIVEEEGCDLQAIHFDWHAFEKEFCALRDKEAHQYQVGMAIAVDGLIYMIVDGEDGPVLRLART